jgi:hypothetical protein
MVQQVWFLAENYPFRALYDYCNNAYWRFLFAKFPQIFSIHKVVGEPCHVVIDILDDNSPIPRSSDELRFNELCDFFLVHLVIQVFF